VIFDLGARPQVANINEQLTKMYVQKGRNTKTLTTCFKKEMPKNSEKLLEMQRRLKLFVTSLNSD